MEGDFLCFSPAGKYVLTNTNGMLAVWDTETGQKTAAAALDGESVMHAHMFSPDEKEVWVCYGAGADCFVKKWDAATGAQILCVPVPEAEVKAVRFAPDGSRVALAGGEEVYMYGLPAGVREDAFPVAGVTDIHFSPDGGYLVLNPEEDKRFYLLDLKKKKQFGHEKYVRAAWTKKLELLCFDTTGRYAFLTSRFTAVKAHIKLWDMISGKCVYTWEGREVGIVPASIAVHPCGAYALALYSDGKLVRLPIPLDAGDTPHEVWLLSRVVSTERQFALEREFDEWAGLIEDAIDRRDIFAALQWYETLRRIPPLGKRRENRRLDLNAAIGRYCRAKTIWGFYEDWKLEPSLDVKNVGYSRDGGMLSDGTSLRDAVTGNVVRRLEQPPEALADTRVNELQFSRDSKLIFCALNSTQYRGQGAVGVWNAETGAFLYTLDDPCEYILNMDLSRDGSYLISAHENSVAIWDIHGRRLMHELKPEEGRNWLSRGAYFGAEAGTVLVVSTFQLLQVEMSSGETVRHLGNEFSSFFISHDHRRALGSMFFRKEEEWRQVVVDLDRWEVGVSLEKANDASVSAADFSPDGRFVMVNHGDGKARCYDTGTGEILYTLQYNGWDVRFDPRGDRVAARALFLPEKGRQNKGALQVFRIEYEYEFPGWTEWDEGARQYLENFLALHAVWTDNELKALIDELQACGYGFIAPEDVEKKLAELRESL